MPVQRLSNTDGFVVYDMEEVPSAGIARRGRKILQRSARDMARSASYTFGLFEIQAGGASAGLSYEGSESREELRSFAAELLPQFEAGELSLYAGKGIRGDLIGEISNYRHSDYTRFTCETVIATARHLCAGDMYTKRVIIEGRPPALLAEMLVTEEATLVEVPEAERNPEKVWSADVDILLVGSRVGVLDHEGAESFRGDTVIGWGPAAITSKALAVLRSKGVQVIPGFLSASGGLLLGHVHKDTMTRRLEATLIKALQSDDGAFIGACQMAEEYMSKWQETPLFGRPLA